MAAVARRWDPWGRLEWRGDWGSRSPLWTLALQKEVRPSLLSHCGGTLMHIQNLRPGRQTGDM